MSATKDTESSARDRSEADTDLLIRVKRNDPRALREFVARFDALLLYQARRMGVCKEDRRVVVTEFLDDILVKLARSPAPKDLAPFVITSFRNFVTDMHRDASARRQRDVSVDDTEGIERVVRSVCSEFMLRAAEPPAIDDHDPSSATVRMLRDVFESCSDQEQTLLIWSAHRVPLRDCAEWTGVSYNAMKQKMYRLRTRLACDCLGRMEQLPDADRMTLTRILNRAGIQTNVDQSRGTAA